VPKDARDIVVVAMVGEAPAERDGAHREDRSAAGQLRVGHVRAYHPRRPLAGGGGEMTQELLEDHHEARAVPLRAGDHNGAGRRAARPGAPRREPSTTPRRPAAGEPEAADPPALHTCEDPGGARVARARRATIEGPLEEPRGGEPPPHELRGRPPIAPPQAAV